MLRSNNTKESAILNRQTKNWMLLATAMLVIAPAYADTEAVTINYGTVESVSTVEKDSKHAGGALAGGVVGALIGPSRHRGLRVAAGAAAGAAVQGAATSGTLQLYSVSLVTGGTVQITTEQTDIREGDCVQVEQGDNANIRRTGSVHCESTASTDNPPAHHTLGAENCNAAKQELTDADTDDEVDRAVTKVRTLCDL
jgi:outer membrane lipoprotein SlyB